MGRRQRRYERRKANRLEKREVKLEQYQSFENVASIKSLYTAAWQSAKGVRWKESVQRYLLNILFNINKSRKDLLAGKDVRKGFIKFDICERGKVRHIQSVHFEERVIQKALCANILNPVMTYNLIADNGASQKNKGTYYATNRLIDSIHRHYNKYGNSGYVLMIDFKSYFDNIEHKPIEQQLKKYLKDPKVISLAMDFVNAFGEKSLGLGSETSQILAVAYTNEIDHYIKDQLRIKAYGRYMDDSYLIHRDKNVLIGILEELKKLYSKFGIKINNNKTHIYKLKYGFTFLKTRFYLIDSGKLLKKACRDSITRERRRLKGQSRLYKNKILDYNTIEQSFYAWIGSMKSRNVHKTITNMSRLFKQLFLESEVLK